MSRLTNKLTKIALTGVLTFGLGSATQAMSPLTKGTNFMTPKSAKERVVKQRQFKRQMLRKSFVTQQVPPPVIRTHTAKTNGR